MNRVLGHYTWWETISHFGFNDRNVRTVYKKCIMASTKLR